MRKIIKGKTYDTRTARQIDYWTNGYTPRDFSYCYESLYLKRTGEFFLHGEGGAMSRYGQHFGDMHGSGEQIRPLTVAEAKEWMEQHSTAYKYNEVFGETAE